MATLTTNQIDELVAQLEREFSALRTVIPVGRQALITLMTDIDEALETAESTVVSGLPAGTGKSWLLANTSIGRLFMERVERKRKEVL